MAGQRNRKRLRIVRMNYRKTDQNKHDKDSGAKNADLNTLVTAQIKPFNLFNFLSVG